MHQSVVFTQHDYDTLRTHLFSDSSREQGALLLAALGQSEDACRFLVRDVLPLVGADLLVQEADRLVVAPHALARAMKIAGRQELSVVLVHTHPGAVDRVGFSPVDDDGEARVFATVAQRVPERPHVSLVFGQRAVAGRVWNGTVAQALDRVVVVGHPLQVYSSGEARGMDAERYDRQVRAFGADGQRSLALLRVGLVGCGGTGSAVAEQLLRLGIGHVLAIDPDRVEDSNVTRVYGSTAKDAAQARYKVELVKRLADEIGRPAAVEPIIGDVRDVAVARRLIGVDILFGCTDSHWSRLILNRMSLQYAIPFIDIGTRIDARGGMLRGVSGRVSVLLPGDPCLFCAGVIRPEIIAAESLPDEERRKRLDEGYIQGVDDQAPAVISLNTVVAGLAVTELLRLATGWGAGDYAHQLTYNALTGTTRPVSFTADPACWCQSEETCGCGDAVALPCRSAA